MAEVLRQGLQRKAPTLLFAWDLQRKARPGAQKNCHETVHISVLYTPDYKYQKQQHDDVIVLFRKHLRKDLLDLL